jgi:predicted dehydrogenase
MLMIGLGIVGTGGIAAIHARNFPPIAGCKLVAACDVDAERVKAFCATHEIPKHYTEVDALLADKSVDAIINATPDPFHAPISIQALAAKKHVLCEKPLALDFPEAQTMVKAAAGTGLINMVNFAHRFAPAVQEIARFIAEGALGEIVHLDACYLQSWLVSRGYGDWRSTSSLTWKLSKAHGSRGVLGDLGVHIFDLATFPVGPLKTVDTRLKTFHEIKGGKHEDFVLDANDTAMATVEFNNGALGTIQTSRWAVGYLNSIQMRIFGSKASLRYDVDQGADRLEICRNGDVDTGIWKAIKCPPTPSVSQRFITSIQTGVNDQPDFKRGAEVQAMLDACFRSDEKRAPVGLGETD